MLREVAAIAVSPFALETIEKNPRGEVHSIFDRTFNILVEGKLIGIGRADVFPGPFHIIVDLPPEETMKELNIERGQPVLFEMDKIKVDESLIIHISRDKLREPKTKAKPKPIETVVKNWDIAREVGMLGGAKGGFGKLLALVDQIFTNEPAASDLSGIEKIAYRRIATLIHCILEGDMEGLMKATKRLVGLGSGLTPSGDDVLSGFMASLWWFCNSFGIGIEDAEKINRAIVAQAEHTTLLSRQILDHASRGEVNEKVERLLESLLAGSEKEVEGETRGVMEVGETSGIDMLVGILFGIRVGLEIGRRG